MKKVITFFIFFITFINIVNASTGTVICTDGNTDPLNVRSSVDGEVVGGLLCNTTVEIINENVGSNDNCSKWYEVKQGNISGFSCGEYISINNINNLNLKGKVSCVENDDPLTVRDNLGGNIIDRLSCDTEMKILDNDLGSYGACSNWYKVSYGDDKIGYVCGTYVISLVDVDFNDPDVILYRNSLKSAGFPDSYLDDLVKLHYEYPNWNFVSYDTGLDWNTVIDNESVEGRNLVHYTYGIGYRSTEPYSYNYATDEYYRHPTEKNWWYASRSAVEYYMDPRNYLNSNNIFTFESLSYEPSFQTVEVIDKILGSSFMPGVYSRYSENAYTSAFIDAATTYNVSPVHLASRILQEQGINGSIASLGDNFIYGGVTYSGYYNFYNIKATGSDPAIQGLVWAMGGVEHNQTSYGRPWDTPYKSILGGARFLSEDYISVGQDTLYFQKFDVTGEDGYYIHQYMQNITAPLTEGIETYDSYSEVSGLFDDSLVFIIPVYDNMPLERVEAPSNKSVNSYLNTIKVNDKEIDGFIYDKFDYTVEVNDVKSINISASSINSNASISGTGTINLNDGDNVICIDVTAENGNTSKYTITINKKVKEEDIVLPSVNTLKSISIDKIDFEFNKDILEYNLETSFDIDKIIISYEADGVDSLVSGTYEVMLIEGINKINIDISLDDSTIMTYVFNIIRREVSIDEVLNNSGIKYNDGYISGISIDTSTESLINNIKHVSSNVSIIVKDKEDNIKSGVFATGDKVIINSGSESKTYEILIYGDVNGDGFIDKLDYLAVLRHYYKYTEYSGVYKDAADANKDGTVDKLDYLAVLRDYYGYSKIEQ